MITLTRNQILSFRRHTGNLQQRLAFRPESLRKAVWAGLQDSVPRAGLLSLHARVQGISFAAWEDRSLVQLWGPRYTVYLTADQDADIFTKGRLADSGKALERADRTAAALRTFLKTRRMSFAQAGREMCVPVNSLRYASPKGIVRLRWDGAQRPEIWVVGPSTTSAGDARAELARRFLHIFGPSNALAFARWAGVPNATAVRTFVELEDEMQSVATPLGEDLILTSDEALLGSLKNAGESSGARLLPSGDPYFLLWGRDRELLLPDAQQRRELWTDRVWPGALLLHGEIVGTWSRRENKVAMRTWRRLSRLDMEQVGTEAASLPISAGKTIRVDWN